MRGTAAERTGLMMTKKPQGMFSNVKLRMPRQPLAKTPALLCPHLRLLRWQEKCGHQGMKKPGSGLSVNKITMSFSLTIMFSEQILLPIFTLVVSVIYTIAAVFFHNEQI